MSERTINDSDFKIIAKLWASLSDWKRKLLRQLAQALSPSVRRETSDEAQPERRIVLDMETLESDLARQEDDLAA